MRANSRRTRRRALGAAGLIVAVGLTACDDSNTQGATTPSPIAPSPSPPPPPANLDVAVSDDNIVTLTWNPAASASSYVVEIGSRTGASDLLDHDTGDTGTEFLWRDVPAGEFFARVKARNDAGTSPASNEVSARIERVSATCPYRTYKPLMRQVSTVGPLCVTGGTRVPKRALDEAGRMLDIMLARRNDVGAELMRAGALTAIFARTEGVCDLPYFSDLAGSASCNAEGGLGGVPGRPVTACSERNVLQQSDDPFGRGTRADGENVCVHELAHTIMNVGLSNRDRSRIRSRFDASDTKELWAGDYALENADEFFAEMSQVYFCANPEIPSSLHTHGVNCAAELRDYDPTTYQLIDSIFRRAADLR